MIHEVVDLEKIIVLFIALVLSAGTAFSHEDDTFQEAKDIIKSKTQCSQLTEEQLKHIGDYSMEQMHPGEAHEVMDKMMGGEGSESLRQMHIALAKRVYCDDTSGMANYGMMGMMMSGMMGGGMMNMMRGNMMGLGGTNMMGTNAIGSGMMGNLGYNVGYWNFVNVLYLILLIGLIILVYFWIIKLFRDSKKKR